ncbi:MAG: cyclic nucleotide-binding domain-containing protein [Fidelibacterota bacterium]|nr:MAG: cyclic nucleotide-binding domain-containing protein [Candidatus Neomarinimicrobiota bacterium]
MTALEQRLKRYFKKGEEIFRDGEHGQTMFIVLEGQVEISKVLGDQKTVIATLEKGSILGEMAIIDNQPRSATATAAINSTLLEISREMFRNRMEEVPNWLRTFFAIIVERLRDATRNQSILLTRGAGRQVVNLLALMARQEEPDSNDRVLLPWNQSVITIAFLLGLNEDRVNEMLNNMVSVKIGSSEQREGIGRVFLLEFPEKLYQFADYCQERHLIEVGHAKKMSDKFIFKDPNEVELLQVLDELAQEQGAVEDFAAQVLEERLQQKFEKPLSAYGAVFDELAQSGILEAFHPEGSEPSYRVNDRDLFRERLAKVQLMGELSSLEKKIM